MIKNVINPYLIPNLPQFVVTGHQICWTWNTSQICWIEKRPKLDPNREIHIGASRCYEVLEAFKQYHSLIDDTKRNFKHGLLIDLHGRGMDDGVTQIGKKLWMPHTNYLAMNSSDSFTNLKFQFYDFFINISFSMANSEKNVLDQ